MLLNYFRSTWRNIFHNRIFSLINVVGLSVSMSLGLLVILVIKDQYSYDNFHKDADRIFRVNTRAIRTDGQTESYASSPYVLGTELKENYSVTDDVVRINNRLNADVIFEKVNVPIHGFFADPSFLQVFNFKLQKGNPETALNLPTDILITPQSAKKIFGNTDPMGKTITLKGFGDFTVKGVFEPLPSKSHLEFEAIASTLALPGLEKQNAIIASIDNWTNYYSGYVYIKTKKEVSAKEVSLALADIYRKNYTGRKLETRDKGYEFYLQPLSKITPGPELSNNMGRALPSMVSKFLTILALIIMLMAGLNYTNLMIAKSLKRSREIGVRKVMGAQRSQIFFQFITESIVFALISLIISYGLLTLLKSAFLQLHITSEFSIDLKEDYMVYGYFILFAVLIGIIAGLFPAGYLSSFKPVVVLKNTIGKKVSSRISIRKVLMVVQFMLSIVFISGVLVLRSQMKYVMKADYGINEKNILNIRLQGNDYAKLAHEIQTIPGVIRIGAISHSLGTFQDRSDDYKKSKEYPPFVMRDFIVDANFIENLEMKFVAGNNFPAELSAERESAVILNETSLKLFGFTDASSAIGKEIITGDSLSLTVTGVIKDFNFRPMTYQIGPLALRYKPADFNILSIAFNPNSKDKIIAALAPIWKKTDPYHRLDYNLMSEEIDEAYVQSGVVDILNMISYVSLLSIIIACLGMLGMVMYSTQLRLKEIGIRKVMGASVKDVTVLLSRSFMILIGIGVAIGIPISFLLSSLLLQNFAYKITGVPLIIIVAVIIIALLGLITICSQTIKAAFVNPIKSLRTE